MSLKATNYNSTLKSWYNHWDCCGDQIKKKNNVCICHIRFKARTGRKKNILYTAFYRWFHPAWALLHGSSAHWAVWQSSICSRRIYTGGVDVSPYRYYVTHAKSIPPGREPIQVHYSMHLLGGISLSFLQLYYERKNTFLKGAKSGQQSDRQAGDIHQSQHSNRE